MKEKYVSDFQPTPMMLKEKPVGPISSPQPTLAEIQRHLPALTGRILQLPPVYSAKKINGVAAYKLARKDKPVEMKPVGSQRSIALKSKASARSRPLSSLRFPPEPISARSPTTSVRLSAAEHISPNCAAPRPGNSTSHRR